MGLFSRKRDKEIIRPYTAAVIPAAGSSSRMQGADKLFVELMGIPALAYTLLAFQQCSCIDEIVITTTKDSILPIGDICKAHGITKATRILCGGDSRMASVYAGLLNLSPSTEFVAIHDGARPLILPETIDTVVQCAYKNGAAVPVVPLVDTIKNIKDTLVVGTTDRTTLGAVQTPQVFEVNLIKGALTKARDDKATITDDASALERMGIQIRSVPGQQDNLKITTPADVLLAQALLITRAQGELL